MPKQTKAVKQVIRDEKAAEKRHQAQEKPNGYFVKTDSLGNGYYVNCGKRK